MNADNPTYQHLKRRPISYTSDGHVHRQRYGWAFRPDAVYPLAEQRGIEDATVVEFARWLAWRVPTTTKTSNASPLTAFISAYEAGTRRGRVPSTEQAVAALELANIKYRQHDGDAMLAVSADITKALILPAVADYEGLPRLLNRVDVTEERLMSAYLAIDGSGHPEWFPKRRWYIEWDDAVAADRELRKAQRERRTFFDPWTWVSTRGVKDYQRIVDCVRLWFPTTDSAPLTVPTVYQYRPTALAYKHIVETELALYTSVGDFVLAAEMLGLQMTVRGSVVYASVAPKYALTLGDKNLAAPFHGTPRSLLHGRMVPDDYITEGVYSDPVQEGSS